MNKKQGDMHAKEPCFLMMFRSEKGEQLARVVIESLRTFGGPLHDSPVWAFVLGPDRVSRALPGLEGVHCFPLESREAIPCYPFASKVAATAQAEAMAGPEISALVWLSLDCLIINPPVLFDLGRHDASADVSTDIAADVAFRPVHHRNIGSLAEEPLDDFWRGVYHALGIDAMPYTVKSYVDKQVLRPYFNTHCFAFNPARGLGQAWWDYMKGMVADQTFQAAACRDDLHKIFLHQAILSTLVLKMLDWTRVRLLPPTYNYPLNLLHELPPDLQVPTLNHLVNAVYEDTFPWAEIEVQEPLCSWLKVRLPKGG